METVLNMISTLVPPPHPPPLALLPPPEMGSPGNKSQHAAPVASSAPAATVVSVETGVLPNSSTTSSSTPPSSALTPTSCFTTPSSTKAGGNVAQQPQPSSTDTTPQQSQQPQQLLSPNSNNTNGGSAKQQHQRSTGRTFFRAPGLEAPDESCANNIPTNALVCPDCGFSCSSKFHYNSHRNTHGKHQCPMCNFETRTEGRLKKHMLLSHKREQRFAHGINIQTPPPPPTTTTTASMTTIVRPHSPGAEQQQQCLAQQMLANHQQQHGLPPNSMNSLLNSMLSASSDSTANGTLALESLQSMLNNTNPLAHHPHHHNHHPHHHQFPNSTDALLKVCTDAIANNGPTEKAFNSPQMGDIGHIPLEQLRALTERHTAALLTTSTGNNNTTVNFVGDMQLGSDGNLIGPDQHQPQQNGDLKQEANANNTNNNGGTPRRSGKPKQYKCKQCQNVSRSKKEQWAHARLHIPKGKQLTCDLCDFVTEYKHHLEYHYRNHNGQKPFKCTICDYTCVNKSMLNSHMKSHTPVYQFRCQDCTYQTKYCHSLKMHLKKYNHKRAPGPSGFVDSSDSHGEERPENASSSSIGREDTASFENGAPTTGTSDGQPEAGVDLISVAGNSGGSGHHLLLQQPLLSNDGAAVPTDEMEIASQRLMVQQQLEQMNELIRNAVVNCPHCNFSTGNIDEMNRHLLLHLIATQQQMGPTTLNNEQHALASIYQRLTAQLQQELIPGNDGVHPHHHHHPQQMLAPPSLSHHQQELLSHALAVVSSASQQHGEQPMDLGSQQSLTEAEEERARQMERSAAESIRQQQQSQDNNNGQQAQHLQFTPTTVAAMLASISQQQTPSGDAASDGTAEADGGARGEGTSTSTTATPTSNNNNISHQQRATPPSRTAATTASTSKVGLKREYPFGNSFHPHHPPSSSSAGACHGANNTMQQDHAAERAHSSAAGATATGTCVITNVMPRLMSSIPGLVNGCFEPASLGDTDTSTSSSGNGAGFNALSGHFTGIQAPSGLQQLPFYCQQCEIAFRDAALYQVHRGFHARENPFKCNICGHLSCSALDFNLHLYQAKHE